MILAAVGGARFVVRGRTLAGAASLLLAITAVPANATSLYEQRSAPPWVTRLPLEVSPQQPAESIANGTVYLLFDRQLDLRKSAVGARYTRVAKQYVDELGLREGARIEIDFDPAFERVLLHSVSIVRGSMRLQRLSDERVKTFEVGLDGQTGALDGTRRLVVEIEDLRAGDVADYEYTVVGTNPAFGHHVVDELRLGWEVPVRHVRHRLLVDRGDAPAHRVHGTSLNPRIVETPGHVELVWEAQGVPAYLPEDRLPAWYRPYPYVEISDFENWAEVVRWARRWFAGKATATPEVVALARELTRGAPSQVDKTAALLQFVQGELRYVALELGAASHVPATPAEVLERRYGDCKDKAVTLAALLGAVGVRADVALSSVEAGTALGDRLPSPLAFDHAVVRVLYEDAPYAERSAWLDPTLLYQRGTGAALTSRARGYALPLAADGTGLMRIEQSPIDRPLREIEVRLRLGRLDRPTTMIVDTLLRGEAAERVRRELRASTTEGVERAYRDFYAGAYPGIRTVEPLRIHDDEISGQLRTLETYDLGAFWKPQEVTGGFTGAIVPLELLESFDVPRVHRRTMPLAVEYPRYTRYTVRAEIDVGWAVSAERVVVEDSAMRFERDVSVEGDTLELLYVYRTWRDHVPAADAAAHIRHLARVRQLLTYGVARPADAANGASVRGPSALNWPKVFAASTFVTFLFAALSFALSLRLRPPTAAGEAAGIGGWLHLALLALVATTLSVAHDLAANLLPALNGEDWVRLTSSTSGAYHPFWAPYLLYAAMARALVCASLVGVLALFLLRSRRLPPLMTATAMLLLVVAALEADCLATVGPHVLAEAALITPARVRINLYGAGALCMLGLPYLLRSRRVRVTFVR